MTSNERLYIDIRGFLSVKDVDQFDIDFFAKKHSPISMLKLIEKYVVIEKIRDKIIGTKSYEILAKYENRLLIDIKLQKELKRCKNMSPHLRSDFLFKDSQYLKYR